MGVGAVQGNQSAQSASSAQPPSYWEGLNPGRDHAGPAPSSAATVNPGATVTQTTDGKRIESIALKTTPEVTIKREITYDDQNRPTSDQLVLETTNKNDNVKVATNPNGSIGFDVNGEKNNLSVAPGQGVTIRTNGGDDTISVDKNVKLNVTLVGGDGNDTLTGGSGNDIIEGGNGNDIINGGAGNDYVYGGAGDDSISGGAGNDVLYGGEGADTLRGEAGNDYLEGGRGNDKLDGGIGNDILSGGLGDDAIESGKGNDIVYTGQGADSVTNSGGTDKAFVQTASDKVTDARGAKTQVVNLELNGTPGSRGLKIEGTPEFVERMESDIEMMRSSPTARNMLQRLDNAFDTKGGNIVTIKELQNEQNGFAIPVPKAGGSFNDRFLQANGDAGKGTNADIRLNTSFVIPQFPAPIVVIYHEMAHAYNDTSGTMQSGTYQQANGKDPANDRKDVGINNAERQAVGLPNDGVLHDWDSNAATPPTRDMPIEITENGLRRELGLPDRPSYRF
jgi:Effector protein/RTX calcium-binding nonapeptide repeat (4 copies)